ncbi:MAG TPA: hypothetical protein VE338_04320 [Ktedonobacterales bacterium]|jgi:hypothetical protein|nr:hypothetical protein [Ktedonobacterales bacterium]
MSDARPTATPATTLRGFVAARRAQALLATLSAPTSDAPEMLAPWEADDALLAEAAQTVAHIELAPEKLALLRASVAESDLPAAALRLTPSQAQQALATAAPRAPRRALDNEGALTVEILDALTPDAWTEFVRWLLEQDGVRIEPRPFTQRAELVAWRAEQGEQALVICAWRLERGWPLLEEDLRRMSALTIGEPGTRLVVVTTAEATVGARLAAQAIGGARILDRPALAEKLSHLVTAYQREQEATLDEAKSRAKAATAARKKLLTALTALDEQASAAPGPRKVAGRQAVRKAATQVEQSRRLAAQALMAWETLLTDWAAAFDERAARDGSLVLSAEPSVYGKLAERADHLKKPLLDALRALAKTPTEGDLGYTAWRAAINEELAARCSAMRWRAQLIDPAQWQDFSQGVNDLALQEATRAENAANHAAARADRARATLVERVGAL